ncbi:unnamed protein product, partial [Symbiodinium necroappetens]
KGVEAKGPLRPRPGSFELRIGAQDAFTWRRELLITLSACADYGGLASETSCPHSATSGLIPVRHGDSALGYGAQKESAVFPKTIGRGMAMEPVAQEVFKQRLYELAKENEAKQTQDPPPREAAVTSGDDVLEGMLNDLLGALRREAPMDPLSEEKVAAIATAAARATGSEPAESQGGSEHLRTNRRELRPCSRCLGMVFGSPSLNIVDLPIPCLALRSNLVSSVQELLSNAFFVAELPADTHRATCSDWRCQQGVGVQHGQDLSDLCFMLRFLATCAPVNRICNSMHGGE